MHVELSKSKILLCRIKHLDLADNIFIKEQVIVATVFIFSWLKVHLFYSQLSAELLFYSCFLQINFEANHLGCETKSFWIRCFNGDHFAWDRNSKWPSKFAFIVVIATFGNSFYEFPLDSTECCDHWALQKDLQIKELEEKRARVNRENRLIKSKAKAIVIQTATCWAAHWLNIFIVESHTRNDDEDVEIVGGMRLGAAYIQFLTIAYRTKPSNFLRQLIFNSGLMTIQEICGCTVKGRKSPVSTPAFLNFQILIGNLAQL